MSFSYYSTNVPAQDLENLLDDEKTDMRTANVYQNEPPVTGDQILIDATQSIFDNIDNFSKMRINSARQNGVLIGVVRLIMPPHTFVRQNGDTGTVQSIIVVDTLAKSLNSEVWRYKIVIWDEQAKNLTIETNRVYRFEHFKMKLAKGNCNYPGQDTYEIHLTPISTIVEVTA